MDGIFEIVWMCWVSGVIDGLVVGGAGNSRFRVGTDCRISRLESFVSLERANVDSLRPLQK